MLFANNLISKCVKVQVKMIKVKYTELLTLTFDLKNILKNCLND